VNCTNRSRVPVTPRVQAGSGCKPGESWYLLTYRSQPALTSANMASPKVLKRRKCYDLKFKLDAVEFAEMQSNEKAAEIDMY